MKKRVVLRTQRLILKPLEVSQITPDYIRGLNDPEVNRYLLEVRLKRQTMSHVQAYVRQNWDSPDQALFGISLLSNGRLIGTIRLSGISRYHYSASVGICIFDRAQGWGHGYGREALSCIIQYAFGELSLHALRAGAYLENKASVRLFKSAGFKRIAYFPDHLRIDNRFTPAVILGLTNPHFKGLP